SLEYKAFRWLVLSAVCLALTGLTKHILAWQFISMSGTLLLFGGYRWSFRDVLWRLVVVSIAAITIFGSVLLVIGVPLGKFLAFMSVASEASEPLIAKLFHLSLTCGLLFLTLPLALLSTHRRWKWFMVVWFILATVPFLVAVPRVEVRYLMPGFIPLAGVVWLALDSFKIQMHRLSRHTPLIVRRSISAIAIAALIVTAALAQPFTAHEVRIDQFEAVRQKIQSEAGDQPFSILIPWQYTDFHYLRVTYPNLPVFSVYEDQNLTGDQFVSWQNFQEKNYPNRILRNFNQVSTLEGIKFYIGYGYTFPIENIEETLKSLPQDSLRQKILAQIQSMSPLIHLEKSWIWNHGEINLQPMGKIGHYQIFRVELLKTNQ
ncbi:MAG: hypothetical protein RI580_16425, partial [Halothece sp. Uz-M2-17]|nr:hypothetical protein [Halothece sp. Uz-M2-17]